MNPPEFRPYSGRVETRTLHDLKYRITHSARADGVFIIDAAIRLHNGVRFLCESWPSRPSEALLFHRCLQYGEFSARPYLIGQAADDSTLECVLALYYDCCRRTGIDATELMVRSYPGGEGAEDWTDVDWRKILDASEWHGTVFPASWGTDELIGLLMSLTSQKRVQLAAKLEQAIALRNLPRLPSGQGEPS
jgi:hypothetical protein